MSESLAYDLDSLAVDVFELADSDLQVESLTGGHGMTTMGASCPPCFCSESCCCIAAEPTGMGASVCTAHRLCSGSCCCGYEQPGPEP